MISIELTPGIKIDLTPDIDRNIWFGELTLIGVPHRVSMLRVQKNSTGYWETMHPGLDQELEKLHLLSETDGELWPVEIPPLEGFYLCYVYPVTR